MDQLVSFFLMALPSFIDGMRTSLQLTVVGLSAGFVIGLILAFGRVYGGRVPGAVAAAYSEFFRGTPLLVQLFVIYYGLPQLNLTLSAMLSAYIALGLNSGAYQAEYFRGAIQSISSGQMMAARAIGMSRPKAIVYIILPQAVRLALPAWSNEAISMIKYTAVVYLIAVPDLMTKAKMLASRYYSPIEAYLSVAVVYLFLVAIIALLVTMIERRLRIPGLDVETGQR